MARIHCRLPYEKAASGSWAGVHYILVLAVRTDVVAIGDPYPQRDLAPVRDVPRSKFEDEWRKADNWAVELRPASVS